MNLRLIEYFVAVIDHGGVTRAAQALYVAQPSLSQAIRRLERELGAELFDRSGRQLRLTPDGASFAVAARQILQDAEYARARVEAVRELAAGRLELAATAELSVDPLPALASGLRRAHPGIVLTVADPGGTSGVVAEVREGRCELGLTPLPDGPTALAQRALGEQEIVLVLPPELAEPLPDPVPLSLVAGIPLVLETTDTDTRELVDGPLRVAVECANRQAILELVRHGAGATFLPRGPAERELTGVVVRSTVPEIRRPYGLVFRPGPLSPAARAFLRVAGVSPDEEPVPARRRPDRPARA